MLHRSVIRRIGTRESNSICTDGGPVCPDCVAERLRLDADTTPLRHGWATRPAAIRPEVATWNSLL